MVETPRVPQKGFYYHYKHDPSGAFNNYAYEVVGLARHTEEQTRLVIYRPLYENTYLDAEDFSVRPLDMFNENVIKNEVPVPRFSLITDLEIISKLEEIKARMYPVN